MRRRFSVFLLGLATVLTGALACQSSGPAVVSGTGRTNEPANGPAGAPTPEWTPRPTPPPTLPPPGILPTRTPK